MTNKDPVFIASILVEADPEQYRTAIGRLIDVILEAAPEQIFDWGTFGVTSARAIDADTGEEFVKFGIVVRGLADVSQP